MSTPAKISSNNASVSASSATSSNFFFFFGTAPNIAPAPFFAAKFFFLAFSSAVNVFFGAAAVVGLATFLPLASYSSSSE